VKAARLSALGPAVLMALLSAQGVPDPTPRVDRVFDQWKAGTPGCAVSVAEQDRIVLERAYGMADLEHDVPVSSSTIFEAGSVA
jgi:CubicO group peptidase (beta-lactamase class C family)